MEFSHRLRRVVVALTFHAYGRIRNPGAARQLKLRFLRVDLCARYLDFGPLSERDVTQLRNREMRLVDGRCGRRAERRERVAIHQGVELRLRVRQTALEITPRFQNLTMVGLGYEHVGRALQTVLISRPADVRNLPQGREILAVDLQLVVSIRQPEIGAARFPHDVQLGPPNFLKDPHPLTCSNPSSPNLFTPDPYQFPNPDR